MTDVNAISIFILDACLGLNNAAVRSAMPIRYRVCLTVCFMLIAGQLVGCAGTPKTPDKQPTSVETMPPPAEKQASEPAPPQRYECVPLMTSSSYLCLATYEIRGDEWTLILSVRNGKFGAKQSKSLAEIWFSLRSNERVDWSQLQIHHLEPEIIIAIHVEKGLAAVTLEKFMLLFAFDQKTNTFRMLPDQLVCQKVCTLQLLTYKTSVRETLLFYESIVNGQHLMSTYALENGVLRPVEIEEPRNKDSLTGGRKAPASVPVCKRTQQVRAEIERRLGGKKCDQVTEADLDTITFLELSGTGIERLRIGDFTGMKNLSRIELASNPISSIEGGLFSGLFVLRSLNFQKCRLTTLPSNVFAELAFLKELLLNHNQIRTLPKDAFKGLTSLTFLSLNNNFIARLPEGIFDSIPKNANIYLNDNPISKKN